MYKHTHTLSAAQWARNATTKVWALGTPVSGVMDRPNARIYGFQFSVFGPCVRTRRFMWWQHIERRSVCGRLCEMSIGPPSSHDVLGME